MFLTRVALGEAFQAKEYMQDLRTAPCRKCGPKCRCDGFACFGSVFALTRESGGVLDYPEHIVYDARQMLPVMLVRYVHNYLCECAVCCRGKM